LNDVNARAKQGIKLLMGRQVFLQIFTFVGGVVLSRVLDPAEFGLYAIVNFLVGTFSLFGDFGLVPSFIQRRSELTEIDLRVGFTLQQIMITLVVFTLFIAAPWLVNLYPQAPMGTVWLVRILAFNLYFNSWRSMSALNLERGLQYDRLVRVEVAAVLSYQGILVILALRGYGVWSFAVATLTSGLLSVLLMYLVAPWRVRFGFDKKVAKDILRFGIPFQLQNIASQAGGWLTPFVVGRLIGTEAVGYLSWSSSQANKPLVIVENILRVAFPHFARIQDNRSEIERLVSRYLSYLLLLSGLWFVILLLAGPLLVRWIYTEKWLPAVPAMVLYAAAISFHLVIWLTGIALNSCGLVGLNTRLVLLRTVGQIVLGIPLVFFTGYIGVPIAYLLVEMAMMPWVISSLGRGAAGRILKPLSWVLISITFGILAGSTILLTSFPLYVKAVITSVAACMAYLGTFWIVGPQWLKDSVTKDLLTRLRALRT